jgi:hypothetical protein
MKNLMATAAVVGLLMTGTAYAAQTTLSYQQMDTVTAGFTMRDVLTGITNVVGPVAQSITMRDNILL